MLNHQSHNDEPAVFIRPTVPAAELGPRYDHDTAHQVITLAQRLQEAHQDTVSAREIEAMAAEMGIEPRFVRQALGIVTRSQNPVARQQQRTESLMMYGLPVCLFVFLSLYVAQMLDRSASAFDMAILFMLPLVVTAFQGSTLKHLFRGAIAGVLSALALFLSIYIPTGLQRHSWSLPTNLEEQLVLLSIFAVGAIVGGLSGWLARNHAARNPSSRQTQRLQEER